MTTSVPGRNPLAEARGSELPARGPEGPARIRMPESVTVNGIAELHHLFLEAVRAKQNIEIDFERTTELDASAVQLLYRACQAAGSSNLTVEQDERSCIVFGMPQVAIKMGAVDRIMPLEGLAGAVAGFSRR